ncbi:MAG: hypothetical protein HFI81_10290 [Eubacterium sp.]|jgi:hypothetical protein|nr:hypothetical protein [Eubacterium sp.]
MKIGGVNQGTPKIGLSNSGQEDAYSKHIKTQIAQIQKEMQQLSSNEELSAEEKQKKRQEYQQKITELNNQLRQHEIDKRREKQQEQAAAKGEEQAKERPETNEGISKAGIKSMISADSSMKQAKSQGTVVTKLKGEARVTAREIKTDLERGGNVGAKQELLANVNQSVEKAEGWQFKELRKANHAVLQAAKSEIEQAKKENKEEKTKEEKQKEEEKENENNLHLDGYIPVDIKL